MNGEGKSISRKKLKLSNRAKVCMKPHLASARMLPVPFCFSFSLRDNKLRHIIHMSVCAKQRVTKKLKTEMSLSSKILRKINEQKDDDVDDIKRKKRKDALPEEVVGRVTKFYHQSDVSREFPDRRAVKRILLYKKHLRDHCLHLTNGFRKKSRYKTFVQ